VWILFKLFGLALAWTCAEIQRIVVPQQALHATVTQHDRCFENAILAAILRVPS
jgi:hypothetical protein